MRVLEVLVKRNLGGDRLFQNYLLLKVERTVKNYSVPQYCKLIRLLADKRYTHDIVFWTDYILKYVETEDVQGGVKTKSFKPHDAKTIWDAFIYLKLLCPELDLTHAFTQIEMWLPSTSD